MGLGVVNRVETGGGACELRVCELGDGKRENAIMNPSAIAISEMKIITNDLII